ncbi:MAG: hypothetical protein KAG84_04255 [Bacteroidales bacterium]|nr:hypothetical protein [Bacteroidales bacterium]
MSRSLVIISTIFFLLSSCIKESPETYSEYFISNNTSNKIILVNYKKGLANDSLSININESYVSSASLKGGSPSPPPFSADSTKVIFNDTISIVHYRIEGQDILRNIFLEESWDGGSISEYKYRYEYNFSEKDYQEAIDKM